ncbi:MAG: hypothetical protein Q7S16_04825 [bacterium]|nr:hypothetical protein [bacterium]
MADFLSVITDSVGFAFRNLWESFILFLPDFIGAILVLIFGWIIAAALGRLAQRLVLLLKIDKAVDALRISEVFERAGVHLNAPALFGWLVKWFLLIVTFLAAADVLQWTQLSEFLSTVVAYLPNVIIAAVILLIGTLVANFVSQIVHRSVEMTKFAGAEFLSGIAKWALLVFTFLAALNQLQIAEELIQSLFTAFVAMLAIAGGLAFGLGGKEHATRFLDHLRKDLSSHK